MAIMGGAQTVLHCASPIVSLIVFFIVVGLILSRVNEKGGRAVREANVKPTLMPEA